jgi:hypothetical protein
MRMVSDLLRRRWRPPRLHSFSEAMLNGALRLGADAGATVLGSEVLQLRVDKRRLWWRLG